MNGPEVCDDGNTDTETACPCGTPSCARCNATCSPRSPSLAPTAVTASSMAPRPVTTATATLAVPATPRAPRTGSPPPPAASPSSFSYTGLNQKTFTLSDGINPALVFEYDTNGSVVGPNLPVDVSSATSTHAAYAVATAAAINAVGAELRIIAVVSGPTVNLTNEFAGSRGNQNILTNAQRSSDGQRHVRRWWLRLRRGHRVCAKRGLHLRYL